MIFQPMAPGFLAQTCPDCNGDGVVCSGVGRDQWPPLECPECGGDGTIIREDIVAVALGDVINMLRDEIANVATDYGTEMAHLPQAALLQFRDRLLKEYGVQG